MNFYSISISILLLLIVDCSLAQRDWKPGYIISFRNDTTHGFIEKRDSKSLSEQILFKQENGKPRTLTPTDIAAYRFLDGKFFVSKKVDEAKQQTAFFEFIINGKVNIFHLKDGLKSRYFIEKNGELSELKNSEEIVFDKFHVKNIRKKREFLGVLSYLLADANMQSDINSADLNAKSLTEIAKKYHDTVCDDEECIIYERSPRRTKINLGIYGGGSLGKVFFGGLIASNYSPFASLGLKCQFENVFEWSERLFFRADLNMSYLGKHELYGREYRGATISYDAQRYLLDKEREPVSVNIGLLTSTIPITVNYYLSTRKTPLYFGAGISSRLNLMQNKNFEHKYFQEEYGRSFPLFNLGLIARFGGELQIKGNHKLFLELNYDYHTSLAIDEQNRFFSNAFALNLGYTL